MSSSNSCGGIAKMKRSICMSMKPSATPTRGMPLPDFL
jgi:hypothetical protein